MDDREEFAALKKKWTDALASAVRHEAGRVNAITDHGFELGIDAFLKAALDDGWKMTPKQATKEMFQEGASVWEWMWNAAPGPDK